MVSVVYIFQLHMSGHVAITNRLFTDNTQTEKVKEQASRVQNTWTTVCLRRHTPMSKADYRINVEL